MSGEPDHLPRRLWWVLASLTLAWGFNWTAMKTALAEVPPWTFRSLCLGLGSAVLFAALRAGGQRLVLPSGQWHKSVMRSLPRCPILKTIALLLPLSTSTEICGPGVPIF